MFRDKKLRQVNPHWFNLENKWCKEAPMRKGSALATQIPADRVTASYR